MSKSKFLMHALAVAWLFTCLNSVQGLRILGLFPYHAKSHFVMCEELMRGLAAKGHQVDVYGHFPLQENVTNYRDFSLRGTLPAIMNNISYSVMQAMNSEKFINHWFSTSQSRVCDLMGLPIFQELLHNPPKDPSYDLVITELSLGYCYIPFGRHLNIPVIGVVTSLLIDWQYYGLSVPVNIATDPSITKTYTSTMSFIERLDNLITFPRINQLFAKVSKVQNEYVEKYFGPGLPSVVDLMKDLSLVLVNHDMSLNGVRLFPPKVIPAGGLHIVDRNETLTEVVKKWLDESTSGCIYFSFGSMTRIETFPKHILDAFYRSFENIAPVRVLMKIAKPEELPAGLPSNVLTQAWLQQMPVLKHKNLKAFVTHGGLMGTQESIYFAVPMIGVPIFADQHFNIETYAKMKIAIKVNLPDITANTFTSALKDVLENTIYRENVREASVKLRDHPVSVMDTATFWVEYIHRHGKDVLKSPIEDLPWWQASLLDIYAFIIAVTSLGFYIIYKILQKIIGLLALIMCFRSKSKAKQR